MMNKRKSTDYYDDENLMTIVDYHEQRRIEDISPKVAPSSVALPPQSSGSKTVGDVHFVTERFGPLALPLDEIFEPISFIEAGELVSIELVTDSPYAQIYLELDDFKNREPNGESAASLIAKGKTEYSERHFYVENNGVDGGFVMKYHPRKTDSYKSRIRISVRNNIKKSKDLYGKGLSYTSRGGLPSPAIPSYMGGGTFEAPGMGDVSLDNMQNAIARPIGTNPYEAPNVYNTAALDDEMLELGALHPYLGRAGKPSLALETGVADAVHRAVFFPPGTQATTTAGATAPVTTSYPGTTTQYSEQQIIIYGTAAESDTLGSDTLTTLVAGKRLYIRDGDKVHFPGEITNIKRYDSGGSAFVNFTGSEGTGAYLVTVQPGLNYTPDKVVLDNMSTDTGRTSTRALGVVTSLDAKPTIIVRELVVRRKKRKSLVG